MANSGKVLALREPSGEVLAKPTGFTPVAYTARRESSLRAVPSTVVASVPDAQLHGSSRTEPCALFSGISPSDRQAILSSARQKTIPARNCIFVQGDEARHVYLLVEGYVKIHQVGSTGNEVILRLMSPGDLIKASGMGSRGTHSSSAQAIQSCNLLVWEAATYEALLERHPILRRNEIKIHGQLLTDMEDRFREMSTEGVAHRLSRQIVRLLHKIGERVNGDLMITLSQGELAQLTGTTLFTVSRQLSKWERKGFVTARRNTILVHDPDALLEAVS
jgi:CRP-like cAMP-binding protein